MVNSLKSNNLPSAFLCRHSYPPSNANEQRTSGNTWTFRCDSEVDRFRASGSKWNSQLRTIYCDHPDPGTFQHNQGVWWCLDFSHCQLPWVCIGRHVSYWIRNILMNKNCIFEKRLWSNLIFSLQVPMLLFLGINYCLWNENSVKQNLVRCLVGWKGKKCNDKFLPSYFLSFFILILLFLFFLGFSVEITTQLRHLNLSI